MMLQKHDDAQKRRDQLNYRRKIAIIGADLRKAEKEQQSLAMEIRRFLRKRAHIDEQISQMEKRAKKVDNEVRILRNDLKTTQKRLNRIS